MEKENIKIRKKECELVKQIQIIGDILVPDTKPDIINMIGTNGNGIVKKIEISDSKIRLDGMWNGNLIYLSDLGETKSLNITLDFSDIIEDEKIKSNDDIEYSIEEKNINVRILNERKISIEILLEVFINDYKIEEIEIISKLTDDNLDIQKLEKFITIKEFLMNAFTKTDVNEDMNFSEQGKNIDILKKDIIITNVEKKISYNKILAKAEASIGVLYLCDNEIKKFKCSIPIMSFLEIENVKEENLIDLKYDIRKFIVTDNVYEKGILNFDIGYDVSCNVYSQKQITIIEDLYSLNNDIKYSKKYINMECIDKCNNKIFEYSEKIGIDDLKDIYDYKYSLKKMKQATSNTIESAIVLDVYYCKTEKNSLMQKSIEIPFIINSDASVNDLEIEFCEIKSVNEEYNCNFKIKCIENVKYENVPLLNEYEVVECTRKEDYSMIIYFVKPNDTIWNIAKKFKVSQDNLLKINNLSTPENIMPGEKLYIMRG